MLPISRREYDALVSAYPPDAQPAKDRAAAATFTNPLLASGPDPYVVRDGDTYYYMHTMGDRLDIWKTKDITDLAHAERRTVWRPSPHTPNGRSIWAPELHRIAGKWYIYYTAADSAHDDDDHRGVFVLENASADPMTGEWKDLGRVNTAHPGIDGTTFAYRGKRYFVYSPYVGPDSDLAIAEMRDPVTLAGPEVIIARPDKEWEQQGGRQILEGPAFLPSPGGDLYLAYSGSACWSDDYAIGLLHAGAGSDPLNPASWRKSPRPVLKNSAAGHVFAPGHNGFFTTPSGETWIVYHANPAADMGCTSRRAPHIQQVRWQGGKPVFPMPDATHPLERPQ
ncbi:glycoside hydrolase family 43 protein [Stakelama sp. CBK3Z-3]|uniref:Glycoside hydrolase family 43 protein n=2 Tax=Stakelama flava TaxID=2860338 RepID=A0ABS6XJ23_9SPHN|nr:glycoside hydrolase family 43 protein [Stakelama flava]